MIPKKCPPTGCCTKHPCGIPIPHNERRECCGLNGCGPHGCFCYCGVSCHSPLCTCPKEYRYFLNHPQPQYPYTQPDYDGAAGLKKLCHQCCDCPPYFLGGFQLNRGCKLPPCSKRGTRLKQVDCGPSKAIAQAEAKRRSQFYTRKPCCDGQGDEDECCELCSQNHFDKQMNEFLKMKKQFAKEERKLA